MNTYDLEAMKTRIAVLEIRVTNLETEQFTSADGARLADQIRDLKEDVEFCEEVEDPELTPNEELALVALQDTDYEDDSPEAIAFVHGFLAAVE